MLASATEVEVELDVPQDTPTFFGVTWAQHLQEDKVTNRQICRMVSHVGVSDRHTQSETGQKAGQIVRIR